MELIQDQMPEKMSFCYKKIKLKFLISKLHNEYGNMIISRAQPSILQRLVAVALISRRQNQPSKVSFDHGGTFWRESLKNKSAFVSSFNLYLLRKDCRQNINHDGGYF